MCWTIFKDTIEWLSQLVTIVGIGIAYYGLTLWKKQMLWQNNYNLAKKILIHIYKIDECIEKIRSISMNSKELDIARSQIKTPANENQIYWHAIQIRFENGDTLVNELRVLEQQAKIFLTSETLELTNELRKHYKVLGKVFQNEYNVTMHNEPTKVNSNDELTNLANKYTPYATKDEDDVYFKELAEIIEKLETHLRPYLIHQSFPFLLNILNKK